MRILLHDGGRKSLHKIIYHYKLNYFITLLIQALNKIVKMKWNIITRIIISYLIARYLIAVHLLYTHIKFIHGFNSACIGIFSRPTSAGEFWIGDPGSHCAALPALAFSRGLCSTPAPSLIIDFRRHSYVRRTRCPDQHLYTPWRLLHNTTVIMSPFL